jgi:predicted dinucleotide-binding enzyme
VRIAVLGTGIVARTVGAALVRLGEEVTLGTRDVEATLARTDTDVMGNVPLARWREENPAVRLDTYRRATADADLVVNATAGSSSLAALHAAGAENLAGKVLLDLANPLDHSADGPPTLFVKDTDSLAEQIQRAFPDTRVVKSLNTMSAHLMVAPGALADGGTSVFTSGDDPSAKQVVTELLHRLGWRDVIDLGDLSTARGTEMLLPVWVRLWQALGTGHFNFAVAR